MHLVDADLGSRRGAKGPRCPGRATTAPQPPSADTLGRAADATGLGEDELRTDELANIRGGAALLAAEQRTLGLPGRRHDGSRGVVCRRWPTRPVRPGGRRCGLRRRHVHGHRDRGVAAHGRRQGRRAAPTSVDARASAQLARLGLLKKAAARPVDCPPGLDCEWIPAPYEKLGAEPATTATTTSRTGPRRPEITNIVIHNTEASYDTTLKLVTDPTYLSWQYIPPLVGRAHRPAPRGHRTSAGTRATGTSTATRSASSTRASRRPGRSGSASRCTARRPGS